MGQNNGYIANANLVRGNITGGVSDGRSESNKAAFLMAGDPVTEKAGSVPFYRKNSPRETATF